MLCPFCGKRTDSHKPSCQHCGKSLRAPRRTAQEPDAPETPLRVYNDETYVRPPRRRRPDAPADDMNAPADSAKLRTSV